MKEWMKYLWSPDKLAHPTPSFFEIDLSNRCNLECSWCCAKEARLKNPVDMEIDMAYSIVDEAYRSGIGVSFSGGGEPTLHPNFGEIIEHAKKCIGVGLVSNGAAPKKIKGYLETMEGHKNFWVRLSLNDRSINNKLRGLFKEYPGQIGISIVDVKADNLNVEYPAEGLAHYAKFISRKLPSDETPIKMTPQECIGRNFEKVFEVDGTVAWCCQARGLDGKPPVFCFEDCRWSKVRLEDAWEDNPWT